MALTPCSFPNETAEYRSAREALLQAELELRAQTERVAEARRALPLGGRIKEDYVFERFVDGRSQTTKMSELFLPGKDTLFVYSLMFGPDVKAPCPMCSSFLDGLNGQIDHLTQRIGVAIVAKSPIQRIIELAKTRDWEHLPLLSSHGSTYNSDYFGEDEKAEQMPMANVFVRKNGAIHHFWGSEMLYAKTQEGDARHIDSLWPLWNVLDLTPDGRGSDFYPRLSYAR